MTKFLYIIPVCILMSACSTTHMVPQAYMPDPPEVLMKPPQKLSPIKKEEVK